jgi:TPR repeat protein
MKLQLAGALLVAAAQAQAMTSYCEAEMAQQETAALTQKQRDALDYYKQFNANTNGRYAVGSELVRRHLDNNEGGAKPDDSPVSACLLKSFADSANESPTSPYAQEAYALRLLAGSGVVRNKELAITYLERAANWGYPSASMHLAKLYLAEKNSPQSKQKAVYWLEHSAFNQGAKSVGGWSAGPDRAIDILFSMHIAAKQYEAAEALYRRARMAQYPKSMLAWHLNKIPGLKPRIEAEEAEAERLRAQRVEDAFKRREKTCFTYYNGYKDCRYSN